MEQEMEAPVEYILIIKAFEAHGLGTSVEFSLPVFFWVINNQAIESISLSSQLLWVYEKNLETSLILGVSLTSQEANLFC